MPPHRRSRPCVAGEPRKAASTRPLAAKVAPSPCPRGRDERRRRAAGGRISSYLLVGCRNLASISAILRAARSRSFRSPNSRSNHPKLWMDFDLMVSSVAARAGFSVFIAPTSIHARSDLPYGEGN